MTKFDDDMLDACVELLKEDDATKARRYATKLHDLTCAIREAMVRIESEKFDLSQSASPHEILFTKCAQRDLDIIKECCGEFL